ncbi:helix-turn-helix domain-containing protein [Streptosporangium lutulentum]
MPQPGQARPRRRPRHADRLHLSAAPHREGRQRQYPALPTTGPVPDSLAPLLDWITANLGLAVDPGGHGGPVGDVVAHPQPPLRRTARHLPGRWLLDRRIAGTRALLEETDLPVETIAQRVGLSSAVNLRRRFRNALDTTPAAYRRSFR